VFLDSSALNDLRNLVAEGVHKSDTPAESNPHH
jgi:hypothetical protein